MGPGFSLRPLINRDLEAAVEAGCFREDLYYRLNVMPVFMPALRERPEDIPDLARFLVERIGKQQGRTLAISDGAIRALMRHSWPGNVRELENCIKRAVIMADGTRLPLMTSVCRVRSRRKRSSWTCGMRVIMPNDA